MSELHVDIVTPEKTVFSGRATELRVPGFEGELGVLPGHAAVLVVLRGGVTTVVTDSGTTRVITGRGFVEAGGERAVVLADSCELAGQSDKTAAQRELEAAERVIADSMDGSDERASAEQAAERARARLEA